MSKFFKTRNLKFFFTGLLFFVSFQTKATLIKERVNNVDFIYSSLSNFSYSSDLNLFGTLASQLGESAFIENIIASNNGVIFDTPNVTDTPSGSGVHSLTAADFSISNDAFGGRTSWFGAVAFANYLNDIKYGGFANWDLTSVYPSPAEAFPIGTYTNNLINADLNTLYYNELNGAVTNSVLSDIGFTNIILNNKWTNQEYADPVLGYSGNDKAGAAFTLNLSNGDFSFYFKRALFSVVVGVQGNAAVQPIAQDLPVSEVMEPSILFYLFLSSIVYLVVNNKLNPFK